MSKNKIALKRRTSLITPSITRSKTGVSVNELGDQYVLLGPYFESKARQEVEEEDFPFHHPLGQAVDR